ncbi:histidinol-phosphatase HisJ family protein [Pseudobacteroides cellulosolvens]|uniref:Histidinol-phosphatase n=1 Tax=Pseudobacteroides cellulosolvens ATCC 35603 = DSM 2933 TaxID=398512 RepID=A0A0L6JKF0_9FIRM|nr:histidinol-phosphatase HisJ family protein [Pseudobacteroides cellulosolvens]KNY26249.1 histidinol phosphate phosphatase HisJ family [Pseudobacteroides cellulosolvens ATCC 35603 = DSM 2933]
MKMFDSHVHSLFSGDSEMDLNIACNTSIEKGLAGIAFTDHLDIDYPNFDVNFLIDFEKYSNMMDELKSQFFSRLQVLKGIEVGIQPHVTEKTDEVIKKYDFDFVIASIHVIGGIDPYYGEYFKGNPDKKTAFSRYLSEILYSVENFDNFDVIGHIGYIRRYCNYDDKSLKYDDYCDVLDSILKGVIKKGKGIEVNTSGYRTLGTPIPDLDIIKRYRELGGEIITTGSDAHAPEHIAYNFSTIKKALSDIGFNYIAHFENRKPLFEKIT